MRKFFYTSIFFNVIFIILLCMISFMYDLHKKLYCRIFGLNYEEKMERVHYNQLVNVFNKMPEREGVHKIIFLGDSITEFMYFDEFLNIPDVQIMKQGIAGDTTAGILERLDPVINAHAEKIFILAGVNDIWTKLDLNQSKKNYRAIIKKLCENSPESKIYIQSILPVSESLKFTEGAIEDFNKELKKIAADFKCEYLDIYPLFTLCGKANENLLVDGIHMNGDGMEIWGNFLRKYVK